MKILFLAEGVSLAHIGRPLTLANWAYQNGHEIHFACSKEGVSKTGISSYLFPIYNLFSIKGITFYERVNQGKFFYHFDEMVKYVEAEKKLIEDINPDLVVTDFRLTAPISTKLCNKPLLNLSNSHWSPNAECPFPAPQVGLFKWLPSFLSQSIFSLLRPMAFKVFGQELNRVRRHFGLETKNDFRKLYTDGDFTAYLDLPEFTKINELPKNHFFLGPVIWNAKIQTDDLQLKDKNNIYISMGSTGNNELINPILNSLLKTDSFIILSGVSTAEKNKLLEKYPSLKSRSVIKQLIDPDKLIPKCRLTICHGGSGTVYQSLSYGIPVLCFPTNPDQCLVSYAVQQQKLGRYIMAHKPSAKLIYKNILLCLTDSKIKKNTYDYIDKIKKQNTCQNWIQFLNKLAPKQFSHKVHIYKDTTMIKTTRPSSVSVALDRSMTAIQRNEPLKATSPLGYTIKLANTLEERESAYRLAYQVYLDKGYIKENPHQWLVKKEDIYADTATLIVQDKDKKVIGTISMIFDGINSIPAETIYAKEIKLLKSHQEKIVEISRFAIAKDHRNAKEVLLLLFNYLYIFSYYVKEYSCLTIEVNPRHKEYYRELFCFDEIGKEKPCPNVQNAPAILLQLPLIRGRNELLKSQNLEKRNRTLYPQFIKPELESLVASYLEKQYKPMSEEEKIYFGFTESGIGKIVTV